MDRDDFYEWVASGGNFSFYQNLGSEAYDECYFNPDCVILFPETRRVYWFDLTHLSVSMAPGGARRHEPGNLWRRKLAFSYDGNRMSVLSQDLFNVRIGTATEVRQQGVREVQYVKADRYQKVCECAPDGIMDPQERAALSSPW